MSTRTPTPADLVGSLPLPQAWFRAGRRRQIQRLTADRDKARPGSPAWHRLAQVRWFTQATAEDRLAALWLLLFRTGLRRGEALGLRWADVDLEAKPGSYPQARVVQQVISVGGQIQRGEPKTENGRRVVALDPTVVAALKAWRAQQAAERLAAGPAWAGDPEIFTREDGRVLDPGYVSKRFHRLASAAGLPVMRLHDTRHTNLSHLLAAGVPVADVSKLAGHADIRTTVNTYGHIQADDQLAAALLPAGRLTQPSVETTRTALRPRSSGYGGAGVSKGQSVSWRRSQ